MVGLIAASGAALPRAASAAGGEDVLAGATYPKEWPYDERDFERYDETEDAAFYSLPRFVEHIDDGAIAALVAFYSAWLPKGGDVLDICSSWTSHFPPGYAAAGDRATRRISGMGMNEAELKANGDLTDFVVRDLNVDPSLPYPDASFDAVTCVVSVDYLTRPLEVFREVARVLRPGGRAAMVYSNRVFQTKAVSLWLQTGDLEHARIIGSFFHYAGGFEPASFRDFSPRNLLGRRSGDPLYVVTARRALA
eukprot:tig00001208_g7528.t1